MDEEWKRSFNEIKEKHDYCYRVIEQAVRYEEEEQPEVAIINYKKGIELIDDALATPIGIPDNIDETWEAGCRMIHKMKRTRAEVMMRLTILAKKYPDTVDGSFEIIEVPKEDEGAHALRPSANRPRTYTELAQALNQLNPTANTSDNNIIELLFSCDGVKLYFIKPNGTVTTQDDSILRIVRIAEDESRNLASSVFLQIIKSANATRIRSVEDDFESHSHCSQNDDQPWWIYPLVPGASPCFRTDYGVFILPDLHAEEPGSAVGIDVPNPADEIVLEIFEALLHGVVRQSADGDVGIWPQSTASNVSAKLIKGAYYVSNGLVRGAEKAGEYMSYGTPIVISKINKAPEGQPSPVSENVKYGIEVAKNVTGTAVTVTGYVATKVGSATMALGRFLAPHIQKQGSRLLSTGFGMSHEDASAKVNDALTLAAGAVEGFGTIYSGLEQSASILGTNLANNSCKIIEHKYGTSAGTVANTTFDTVGNVFNITQNVNYMTPRGLVKKTAKGAGKALVMDFKPRMSTEGQYVRAGNLYPDLSQLAKTNEISKTPKIE